jgi:hypothetical protein
MLFKTISSSLHIAVKASSRFQPIKNKRQSLEKLSLGTVKAESGIWGGCDL